VVLSNYRSGSTALCDILHQTTGYKNLDEVFHFRGKHGEYEDYQMHLKTGKPAVIKIMPDQIPPEHYWEELFGNNTIIGIYRRDRVAQVASWCQAYASNIWHKQRRDPTQAKTDLDWILNPARSEWVLNQARSLIKYYKEYVQCRKFMDMEFCYETIQAGLNESGYDIMPKPDQYADLLAHCQSLLEQRRLGLINE
jgi:LPS sulfotransferase NodH